MKSTIGYVLLALILGGIVFTKAGITSAEAGGDLRDSPWSNFRRNCNALDGYAIMTRTQDMVCIKKDSIIEITQ